MLPFRCSTTFASLSPAPLTLANHPFGPPSSLSLVLSTFPFLPDFSLPPLFSPLLLSPPFCLLLSSPLLHPRCVVVCLRLRLLALSLSPLSLRGLAFDPPSYRPPNLVATFGLSNARGMRRPASRRLKSRISFWPTIMMHDRGKKSSAVICGAIISSKSIAPALDVA